MDNGGAQYAQAEARHRALRVMLLGLAAAHAVGVGEPEKEEHQPRREDAPTTLAEGMRMFTGKAWKQEVRFTKDEFLDVVRELRVEESIKLPGTCRIDGPLAFAMMCSRLAQGTSILGQMEHKWRWDRQSLTKWINYMFRWLITTWGHLLELNLARMTDKAGDYAEAVGRKLGYRDPSASRVVGYIDGVFVNICKPRIVQEMYYNLFYKGHGMKFSGIVSPCGILEDCFGPIPGIYHDLKAWYQSRVAKRLDRLPHHPRGGRFVFYGDSAYRVKRTTRYISTAVSIRVAATGAQVRFSQEMNRTRVTIEWMFGEVNNLWRLVRNSREMRTGQSSCGMWYGCAVILTNLRTCVRRGNGVSQYFSCPPPTLREYLRAPKPRTSRWKREMERAKRMVARVVPAA